MHRYKRLELVCTMKCNRCDLKAVYSYNTLHLCRNHFLSYLENKVQQTIRRFKLIEREDKVCVAVSGGKDSLCALYNVMLYCKKYGIKFFALSIDEGIKGYRDINIKNIQGFCSKYEIDLKIVSFKQEYGQSLDNMLKKVKKQGKRPCTVCGILRRTLLNKQAKELKATKLVTGHNLDDEAQSYMMNILKGNMGHNAGLGPIVGLNQNSGFVNRIKPLYFVTEREAKLFSKYRRFKVNFDDCPNVEYSFRFYVKKKLNEIEKRYAGIKQGIVNSFLEILPLLKETYRKKRAKAFSNCKKCGEPCSGNICNACEILKSL